uniref:Exonuclease domain-containing protein n=1 Tax=Sinocyclocheilus rhinocerous TaxID=307959 RepID=A0A673FF94_9TELE
LTGSTYHSKLVAMDCEMVGTGPGGKCSEVARCSIVNYYGSVLYDKYILPRNPVTDYRTRWSGIRKHHLQQAVAFEDAQNEVRRHLYLTTLHCIYKFLFRWVYML